MEISFKDILRIIKKNLIFIIIASLLFSVCSFFVTKFFIKKMKKIVLSLAVCASLVFVSCTETNKEANEAQENIENAAEELNEAANETVNEIDAAANEAGEAMEEAANDAEQAVEEAANEVKEAVN